MDNRLLILGQVFHYPVGNERIRYKNRSPGAPAMPKTWAFVLKVVRNKGEPNYSGNR